jgi:hypothetical protein
MLFAPAFAALVISISTTADVSPTLVDHVVDEANALWKPAGVALVWQREASRAPASVDVIIGVDRGTAAGPNAPLGWIRFEAGRPTPRVYLSYANALALLESANGTVGVASRMPILQRETYLGRALGRSLAHELGHYLLADKTHAPSGLMKANFTAFEFFSTDTAHFTMTNAQRVTALTRLEHAPLVAASHTAPLTAWPSRPVSH